MSGKLHIPVHLTRLIGTVAAFAILVGGTGSAQARNGPVVPSSAGGATGGGQTTPCISIVPFNRDNFSRPVKINNKFFPLIPGTQYILEGSINPGGGGQPHRVIFTVSDVTKVINGVRTLVLWDRDINDGQLVERELAFFAQDNDGNVWNLGEYPEEFEAGQFVGAAKTWIDGVLGTQAGIHMLAHPKVSKDYYVQASAPSVDFLDCARVFKKGQQVCVTAGCYDNVLVTAEISPLVPGKAEQIKSHAPKVGIVQIGALNDPEAETLSLVKLRQLGEAEMAMVRKRVCELDNRGHKLNDVYRTTASAVFDEHACNGKGGDDGKDDVTRALAEDVANVTAAMQAPDAIRVADTTADATTNETTGEGDK